MLKYEWHPGQPIAADDTVLNAGTNENPNFAPEPIMANLPDVGPNSNSVRFNLHGTWPRQPIPAMILAQVNMIKN